MIRTGTVAYELLRPLDVYTLWYMRSVAARSAPTLLRATPMFAIAIPCFGMGLPPSPASAAAWAAATVGALLLASALSTLSTITLLWTLSGEGIARLAPAIMYTLSGMLIPLPFFPEWMQPFLSALPFRDLIDTPFRVYLGQIPPERCLAVLAHQLVWTAALMLWGRWLVARASRRLVVQGG